MIFFLLLLFLLLIWVAYRRFWAWPCKITQSMEKQGVSGPPFQLLIGNFGEIWKLRAKVDPEHFPVSHDLLPRLFPHLVQWVQIYGRTFLHWLGVEPFVYVGNPKMLKNIVAIKSLAFQKPTVVRNQNRAVLGDGLVMAEGQNWVTQRKIMASAFQHAKVKEMVGVMLESVSSMVNCWDKMMNKGEAVEIDVLVHLCQLSSEIIARTSFGSSYEQGKVVFERLNTMHDLLYPVNHRLTGIPGMRWVPTARNRQIWRLRREADEQLKGLIRERMGSAKCRGTFGEDLLGQLLQQNNECGERRLGMQQLVDECKTIYFAGNDTVSLSLSWTLLLLSLNPTWQERARLEIQETLGEVLQPPSLQPQTLRKLKIVGMILEESMRLYPPIPRLFREAKEDFLVGDMRLERGVSLWINTLGMHHDPQIWGQDANEFNPERFDRGVANACKTPESYTPFGFGPRICVGMGFAMLEQRLTLAILLPKFRFSMSPSYRHCPTANITLRPKFGIPLMVEKLG